jgi:hypothetical protein
MVAHKAAFLTHFRLTGNVTLSAQAAGVERRCHSRWMADDPAYAEAFADAQDEANDQLEAEARRRGYQGVDEPVFGRLARVERVEDESGVDYVTERYTGVVGTVRKYSDTLLIFLLKANRPEKFKERHEHSGPKGGPIQVQPVVDPLDLATDEEIAVLRQVHERALAAAPKPESGK